MQPRFDDDDATLQKRLDELRATGGADAERELVALRNLAGVRRLDDPRPEPAFPEPGDLPDDSVPVELDGPAVTPELLRAAILRDGCLLVRGLIDPEGARELAAGIDRTFAERERHLAGEPHDARYYAEFEPDPRQGEDLARPWVREGGGVLAVDSPRLSFALGEALRTARVPELVDAYLGEPGLIAAQKMTLRKAEPSVSGAWHQDGKFMGPVRALNLWLSLSRCGDVAPGLDLVPRRLSEHVTTITDEPPLHYLVSQEVAEQAAGDREIVRPIFKPGDALLFDELFLHKTGSDPGMPEPRYALENWFFGASAFPVEYAPLVV